MTKEEKTAQEMAEELEQSLYQQTCLRNILEQERTRLKRKGLPVKVWEKWGRSRKKTPLKVVEAALYELEKRMALTEDVLKKLSCYAKLERKFPENREELEQRAEVLGKEIREMAKTGSFEQEKIREYYAQITEQSKKALVLLEKL